MTERLKNVALEPATHKALKMLCAENDWTMTQAVQYILSRMEGGQGDVGKGSDQPTGQSSKAKRRKPVSAD